VTATPTVPLAEAHHGRATIAACTVSSDRSGSGRTIVIADTPQGERCVVTSDDPDIADRATTEELIGTDITVAGIEFRL
jgi:hypothetical protein